MDIQVVHIKKCLTEGKTLTVRGYVEYPLILYSLQPVKGPLQNLLGATVVVKLNKTKIENQMELSL